jgi:H+/Cl- antiporter ClcA
VYPFARSRVFWSLVADAVLLGLVGGLVALGFVAVVGVGTSLWWPENPDYDFLGGELWWLAVTTGAGLLVGWLRLVTHVPARPYGALAEIQEARVDYKTAPQTVLVSAISLIGGASLGPFDAGVRSGGAIAEWWSARRGLDEQMRSINALSGMAAGVGALVTAPFVAALLNLELAKLKGRNVFMMLIPNVVAASAGFAVFWVTIGSTFLDVYEVGPYELEAWHLLAAIPLGAAAAAIMLALSLVARLARRVVAAVDLNSVVLAGVGGLLFGVAGVLLPLTLFSGKEQLDDAVDQVGTIGAGLLVAVLVVKIVTFAISMATGFIGGPVMPSLFLGGIAGLVAHELIPDLPLALALSAMLVAVPGAVVKAPFALMALAAVTVSVGPITVAPAGIAVLTAYLLTSGLGLFGTPKKDPDVDAADHTAYREGAN